jgi:hypothetical protein
LRQAALEIAPLRLGRPQRRMIFPIGIVQGPDGWHDGWHEKSRPVQLRERGEFVSTLEQKP